jgi:glutathione S-transferase
MLTVHHLGVSQSDRVVWLCEELELDYALKRYDRRADTRMAPDDYKALHPMGIAPVITDGDLVLGETGAICDYILAKYGKGRLAPAPDSADFAEHLYWLHFANATLMPNMMGKMILAMAGQADSPAAGFLNDRRDRAWAMIERRLGEAPFFGGSNLTSADIMMVFPLTTMRSFTSETIADRPNTRAYLQRIGARPAWQRAMAKAEPGAPPPLD